MKLKVDEKSRPVFFSLPAQGRHPEERYRVASILRWWREPGCWWEGEPVTLYLRLEAAPLVKRRGALEAGTAARIFELYRAGESWYFHRMLG